MKKIVCELCEGMEFTKEGGMFVCQGCGTKYTAEEARGMMREVEGGTSPAGAPAMPMGNPNQVQIDNMLILATNAFEASNNQEAESYCNRAIELDAMSYKAWLLKGKAAGWSSTLGNNRVQEAAHSFCKAIDFAPEDEKDDVKNQAVEELRKFGLACISLRKTNFANNPGADELNGFRNDRKIVLESLAVLITHGNEVSIPEGYQEDIANLMQEAANGGFKTLIMEEANRLIQNLLSSRKPSNADLQTKYTNCVTLLQDAIDASDNDSEADVQRYKDLIAICEHIRDMDCCWDSEKKTMNEKIAASKAALAEVEAKAAAKAKEEAIKAEEEKKARIAAYWEAHADEKKALDAEKKELEDKKSKLNAEIAEQDNLIKTAAADKKAAVPSEAESDKIKNQIRELQNRRAGLGIFAGKEKKQIGEEIASLDGRVNALKGKIEEEKKARDAEADKKAAPAKAKKDELQSQLNAANKRISAIDAALTKDPEE